MQQQQQHKLYADDNISAIPWNELKESECMQKTCTQWVTFNLNKNTQFSTNKKKTDEISSKYS